MTTERDSGQTPVRSESDDDDVLRPDMRDAEEQGRGVKDIPEALDDEPIRPPQREVPDPTEDPS